MGFYDERQYNVLAIIMLIEKAMIFFDFAKTLEFDFIIKKINQ